MGKVIQNTTQAQNDLTIYVYAGKNGSFTLYEDENVNYNYENGKFSKIEFTYNDTNKSLSIAQREGSFTGMEKQRKFRVVYINSNNQQGIDSKIDKATEINYVGKSKLIQL